ncbi:5310_t:CDS:2 [Acaulospora morrowiae]|uniref:5310_t:CDS:1 n=1 Tax=Acaulospora morrowiae TaxID=94023 RepID=A0A9N9BZN2_9GLOM|nr:5310_t:CDS:2 [Acaulospora morrowiae]
MLMRSKFPKNEEGKGKKSGRESIPYGDWDKRKIQETVKLDDQVVEEKENPLRVKKKEEIVALTRIGQMDDCNSTKEVFKKRNIDVEESHLSRRQEEYGAQKRLEVQLLIKKGHTL